MELLGMKRLISDKKSIQNRVRQSTLIVLFIQVILFGVIIAGGGTISRLSDEYLKILNGQVDSRKKYIEDKMLHQWSDLEEFERDIQKEVSRYGVKTNTPLKEEFVEKVVSRSVFALRQHAVSGVFLVMAGKDYNPGIYIRDLDPYANLPDNSDLLMVRGSLEAAKGINASMDRQWGQAFELEKGNPNSDFFYKPFEAAIKYPTYNTKDLGYWSKPFRLSEYDIEMITYSIPLRGRDGEPYAVIGVEVSLDYLRDYLYYKELSGEKQGGYLLGIEEDEPQVFYNVISSGPLLQRYIASDIQTSFSDEKKIPGIYSLDKFKGIYGSVQNINLYKEKTPFVNDQWALVGMVERHILLKPINRLIKSVILVLLFSFAVGMIASYFTGLWFVRPITKLVERVLTSDPSNPVVLSKTKITEIDELAYAIESLSNKVADSASKLSQIISMVNIPIGAFEYDAKEENVFCTETLFEILGIRRDTDSNYIKSGHLRAIMRKIKQNPEEDLENVYSYGKADGEVRWIRMQTEESDCKVLGVIEDVTEDIKAKHKLEHERDHDVLTKLLNRRAFSVKVRKKLEEDDVKNAAFVMWDLDNLKYINDTYGHDFGDQYIKTAASILNESSSHNAIVARMSGDEFYTFIYGYNDKEDIRKRINDIKNKLHTTLLTMPDGTIFRVRASGGVAWYPDDSRVYDELIKYSDFAMYEIKHSDKGNVGEFDKETYDKDSILLSGKEELNQFIEEELVLFEFQPIVDAKTAKVFAYEALMRPQVETLRRPIDIIRLAKSQSKLQDIERLTWFKAMEGYIDHQADFRGAKIFINSIPNHVLSNRDFERFELKYKDNLGNIVLEIIENEQSNELCTKIKQDAVTRWGSHLALDDFGSGYNNEMVLLVLQPKYIKIDMAIIRGIDQDRNRQKLLENILSYAIVRDIKIIAEGVETKKEMDKVIELGVDYLQGYYLGRPNLVPQEISEKIINEILISVKEIW